MEDSSPSRPYGRGLRAIIEMKTKMTMINAQTGSGKTRTALLDSKTNNTIFSVPTIEQVKELYAEAVRLGLRPAVIVGKGNYPCGRSVKISRGLNSDETVSLLKAKTDYELITKFDKYELSGHFECCDEEECPVNIYEVEKERIIKERPRLIITTHAYLKLAGFTRVLPDGYVLVLDEADIFYNILCDPFPPYNAFKLNELKTVVSSISKAKIEKIKKKMLSLGRYSMPIAHNYKNDIIRNFKLFDGFIDEIGMLVSQEAADYSGTGKKKLKHSAIKKKEYLNMAAKIIKNMLYPIKNGMYSYITLFKPEDTCPANKKTYIATCDVSFEIAQDLFSDAYTRNYFQCLNSLVPKEIIALSAFIPPHIENKLKFFHDVTEKKLSDKDMEERFKGSRLNVFIGAKEYEHSEKDDYMDYSLSVITSYGSLKAKPKVVLATSAEQVARLTSELTDRGYNVISKQSAGLSDEAGNAVHILNKFNAGNGVKDVLVGANGLWRGLNITRDSDFYMFKIPFESPDTPKNMASRDVKYFNKKTGRMADSSFSNSLNESMSMLIQGTGRVIRGPGQVRNLYILDNRLITNKRIGFGWLFDRAYYEICLIDLSGIYSRSELKKNKRGLYA